MDFFGKQMQHNRAENVLNVLARLLSYTNAAVVVVELKLLLCIRDDHLLILQLSSLKAHQ